MPEPSQSQSVSLQAQSVLEGRRDLDHTYYSNNANVYVTQEETQIIFGLTSPTMGKDGRVVTETNQVACVIMSHSHTRRLIGALQGAIRGRDDRVESSNSEPAAPSEPE